MVLGRSHRTPNVHPFSGNALGNEVVTDRFGPSLAELQIVFCIAHVVGVPFDVQHAIGVPIHVVGQGAEHHKRARTEDGFFRVELHVRQFKRRPSSPLGVSGTKSRTRSCRVGSVFVDHAALVADFIPFKGHDHILAVFEFDDMGKGAVFDRDLNLLDALALDVFNVRVSSPLGTGHPTSPVTTVTGSGFNSSGRV